MDINSSFLQIERAVDRDLGTIGSDLGECANEPGLILVVNFNDKSAFGIRFATTLAGHFTGVLLDALLKKPGNYL